MNRPYSSQRGVPLRATSIAFKVENVYSEYMTLQAIKRAIRELPDRKRSSLLSWLRHQDAKAWDKQIAVDFSEGGAGSQLVESWDSEIKNGNLLPLSEFLRQRSKGRKRK